MKLLILAMSTHNNSLEFRPGFFRHNLLIMALLRFVITLPLVSKMGIWKNKDLVKRLV